MMLLSWLSWKIKHKRIVSPRKSDTGIETPSAEGAKFQTPLFNCTTRRRTCPSSINPEICSVRRARLFT